MENIRKIKKNNAPKISPAIASPFFSFFRITKTPNTAAIRLGSRKRNATPIPQTGDRATPIAPVIIPTIPRTNDAIAIPLVG